MSDEDYDWQPVKVSQWPFVYRMTWLTAEEGAHDKSWTRRITERGAAEWQRIFEGNREYRLSKGMAWNEKLIIERAPVGEWETTYVGEPVSVLEFQQTVGGG